jgi:hypothetical protein
LCGVQRNKKQGGAGSTLLLVRVKRLAGTAVNLQARCRFIGIDGDLLDVETPLSIWLTEDYCARSSGLGVERHNYLLSTENI